MPTSPTTRALEHLCRTVLPRAGAELGDAVLLGRLHRTRDQARCHPAQPARSDGLGHLPPAAEPPRRQTLSRPLLVSSTRHPPSRRGDGGQLALRGRPGPLQAEERARRGTREVQVTDMPDTAAVQHDLSPGLQPLLDES